MSLRIFNRNQLFKFKCPDEDDLSMKGGSGDRISRLRCNSPMDRDEMDLCQLNVPNVALRSASSPLLNEMQVYPSTNDFNTNVNVQPAQPTPLPVPLPEPVKFSIAVCTPPPVPPRKESVEK